MSLFFKSVLTSASSTLGKEDKIVNFGAVAAATKAAAPFGAVPLLQRKRFLPLPLAFLPSILNYS